MTVTVENKVNLIIGHYITVTLYFVSTRRCGINALLHLN